MATRRPKVPRSHFADGPSGPAPDALTGQMQPSPRLLRMPAAGNLGPPRCAG